jgi:cytochrome c-type biogenesis protein CcmH
MSMPEDATGNAPLSTMIETIRVRLRELADAHARGELDSDAYEAARRDAERSLSEALMAEPPLTMPAPTPTPAPVVIQRVRPSLRLVTGMIALVLVIAIGGYAFTGSPSLAGFGTPPQVPVAANANEDGKQREIGLQQIAGMVDKLAARLKDKPDDVEGWTMLARSYTVLSRFRDALPAYQRAIELQPTNAGLLADYADAMAAANDGKPNRDSLALIDRALAIDPNQPKALALAGTVAFERGDYATAVRQWQKIADALPPESEFHQQVMANIDEARRRGGLAPASPKTASTIAGHEALTGTVTLAPALAAQASPGDTVFVLARPESGRMPLAVFRATVKDLPLHFRLDDSMAMTQTMKISDMKQVIVAARISKSGNAITQPGDLAGESQPVAPGTNDLAIVIGKVVPGK